MHLIARTPARQSLYVPFFRLQQGTVDRNDLAALGLSLLGPRGFPHDRDDRRVSSCLRGEEVPRCRSGPPKRQSYRNDDRDLSVIHSRTGRRIRDDPSYVVRGVVRVSLRAKSQFCFRFRFSDRDEASSEAINVRVTFRYVNRYLAGFACDGKSTYDDRDTTQRTKDSSVDRICNSVNSQDTDVDVNLNLGSTSKDEIDSSKSTSF